MLKIFIALLVSILLSIGVLAYTPSDADTRLLHKLSGKIEWFSPERKEVLLLKIEALQESDRLSDRGEWILQQLWGEVFDDLRKNFDNTPRADHEYDPDYWSPSVLKMPQKDIHLINSLYHYGDENPDITIFEFTNLECPFCKRHHQNDTLNRVRKESNQSIRFVVGVTGGYNPKKSASMVCAGILGGSGDYYRISDYFLSGGTLEDLPHLLQISQGDLDNCRNWGDYMNSFQIIQDIATRYGLTGTPGHIVLNNRTGSYEIVLWAYPVEEFLRVIDMIK